MPEVSEPSVRLKAFRCPHCGVYTTMSWIDMFGKPSNNGLPYFFENSVIDDIRRSSNIKPDVKTKLLEDIERRMRGDVYAGDWLKEEIRVFDIANSFASSCFHCKNITLWTHDRIVYPVFKSKFRPVEDMPDHIKRDFEEAAQIFDASPRAAAAILRLALEKLCQHILDKPSIKLDEAINALVKQGLRRDVQDAMEVVRVIGNNAVHPGQIDTDDREMVSSLFSITNLIVEQTISERRKVNEMKSRLPAEQLQHIERRDRYRSEE